MYPPFFPSPIDSHVKFSILRGKKTKIEAFFSQFYSVMHFFSRIPLCLQHKELVRGSYRFWMMSVCLGGGGLQVLCAQLST